MVSNQHHREPPDEEAPRKLTPSERTTVAVDYEQFGEIRAQAVELARNADRQIPYNDYLHRENHRRSNNEQ